MNPTRRIAITLTLQQWNVLIDQGRVPPDIYRLMAVQLADNERAERLK